MNKLWLIIQREYLTRVRKKSFILVTLLTPLGFGLIMFVSGYLASNSMNSQKKIVVVDQSGILNEDDLSTSQFDFDISTLPINEIDTTYSKLGYDLLLDVPPIIDLSSTEHKVDFYSKEKLSLVALEQIERKMSRALKKYKISKSNINQETLDQLEMEVTLDNAVKSDQEGDKSNKMSIGVASALSYLMGFLMYMVIFIYGSMVMRSVMEEKINRIVEVMISSVRPFQLMLGKVMGVGFVAITQLFIWMILLFGIMLVFGATMTPDPSLGAGGMGEAGEILAEMGSQSDMKDLLVGIKSLNWLLIIPSFIVFFFGGYFIYSSLFAAVGSAMGDDLGEGQQLMMPIFIPVIIAISLVFPVLNNPNGSLAVYGSMFPLFSPILMPARLPFDPPLWQVLLSIVILIASVIFMTWVAGRIYRVGILMYGKKVSFKEIGRWLFVKN
ncbi:MAG: ABC-2 type transport system permease protein [Saprospiraceae bacterium]|jgi:ABC-2 type transport system permease protein